MNLTYFLNSYGNITVQHIQILLNVRFNNFAARMYYRFYFSKVHDKMHLFTH